MRACNPVSDIQALYHLIEVSTMIAMMLKILRTEYEEDDVGTDLSDSK